MRSSHRIAGTTSMQADISIAWTKDAFSTESKLPFSFVYGGRPSSELTGNWEREYEANRLGDDILSLTLTLTDPETRLEVQTEARVYADTGGVDWIVFFTNRGNDDTPVIEQVRALDGIIAIDTGAQPVLHTLKGSLSLMDDWLPVDLAIHQGAKLDFATQDGRSSDGVSPFFDLDWGTGGVITAVGWSGAWSGSVEYTDDVLRTQVEMERTHLVLHPGESIRSPRVMQFHWRGGDHYGACNLFRQLMIAHVWPRVDGDPVLPPIVHLGNSFYEMNASTEENTLSHLESINGLGFEMFWLDAYWTGPNGFPESMGNYCLPLERVEPRDRFPRGVKAIGDAVKEAGLGFVLWFEPERVHPGTIIAREHPEWVISPEGDGGIFNLGIPEAREYMTDYLKAALSEYRVDCLRIDFNIDPLPFWQHEDGKDPNRVGMAQIRYIEGLYRMWDDILATFPHLFIDNCASGGRRIDLETCSRSIPLWRSDNTCDMLDLKAATITLAALKNQVMSAGLNCYLPFSTVGQMGADPYHFRSGFNAGISFAEDCRPADYPRDLLRLAIEEGKRVRNYYSGNFYPLSPVTTSPKDWCVMQYHLPDEQKGMVVAFRREKSESDSLRCNLREMDPGSEYLVAVSRTYVPDEPFRMSGCDLAALEIHIDELPGSVVVEYVRQDAKY